MALDGRVNKESVVSSGSEEWIKPQILPLKAATTEGAKGAPGYETAGGAGITGKVFGTQDPS